MGRKRKKVELKPFCFFCDRTFIDENSLITHQKLIHFKCPERNCGKKLLSIQSLIQHSLTVHQRPVTSIEGARSDRNTTQYNIVGMQGVPPHLIEEKYQQQLKEIQSIHETNGNKDTKKAKYHGDNESEEGEISDDEEADREQRSSPSTLSTTPSLSTLSIPSVSNTPTIDPSLQLSISPSSASLFGTTSIPTPPLGPVPPYNSYAYAAYYQQYYQYQAYLQAQAQYQNQQIPSSISPMNALAPSLSPSLSNSSLSGSLISPSVSPMTIDPYDYTRYASASSSQSNISSISASTPLSNSNSSSLPPLLNTIPISASSHINMPIPSMNVNPFNQTNINSSIQGISGTSISPQSNDPNKQIESAISVETSHTATTSLPLPPLPLPPLPSLSVPSVLSTVSKEAHLIQTFPVSDAPEIPTPTCSSTPLILSSASSAVVDKTSDIYSGESSVGRVSVSGVTISLTAVSGESREKGKIEVSPLSLPSPTKSGPPHALPNEIYIYDDIESMEEKRASLARYKVSLASQ
jgi:hypothetical protein